MATRIRTIEFLPEIFQTKTNDQFLSATLDQLIQPPDFARVQGYIGSKFGYGVKSTDQYVQEPTIDKTNYQLEPTVVFNDPTTGQVTDALTYTGLIDSIRLESGLQPNHNSLFKNEFYSWDSFVDLDKLINFGQYYWIPEGPEPVDITTETVLEKATIKFIDNINSFKVEVNGVLLSTENPILTLVRGGTYTLEIDNKSKFYIQSLPGVKGVDPNKTNFSTREISGIETNGVDVGKIIYNAPLANAQDNYKFSNTITVDLASDLTFGNVNGSPVNLIKNIDGVVDIQGKTIILYGNDPNDRVAVSDFFDETGFDSDTGENTGFDGYKNEPVTGTVFTVTFVGPIGDQVIKLVPYMPIPDDTNILINGGVKYIGRSFVKNSYGELSLIPSLTASLSTLYYQDEGNELKTGIIKLIDKPTSSIINVSEILGQKTYTSPNGVKFTNGLRVKFIGEVFPTKYLNDSYYVEGVGTSIELIPSNELIVPELYSSALSSPFDDPNSAFDQSGFSDVINLPKTPDYITIRRNSLDRNAWSRGNRWFHVDVLKTITEYNKLTPLINKALAGDGSYRAARPIIEFYPNLKLIFHGSNGKKPVDYIDNVTTDALTTVNGIDPDSYLADGANSPLFDGCRIIFAQDNDINVRNKIFVATIATINGSRKITLTKADDGEVILNDQIVIVNGTTNKGYSYYYDGYGWINGQSKTTVNQAPLFDLFDSNGISFSDKEYYPGTDFNGCTLFRYSRGSGVQDAILGIPIQYSGVGNLNDINFETTLNSDTFNYVYDNKSINLAVNNGYVHQFVNSTQYKRKLGWETAVDNSFQYQIFNYVYYNNNTTQSFEIDIPIKDSSSTKWPTSVVYVNNSRTNNYTATVTQTTTNYVITQTLTAGDTITIMAYSDSISNIGYYQIPSNLQQNPFNYQITTINAGDIRGHYKSICNNIPGLTGVAFGANNYRDLGNPVPYGTRIIQNSAPLVPAALFSRKQQVNFYNSLSYNATEYVKFKSLLVNTVNSQDYTPYDSASDMLDDVLDIISSSKTEASPFFYSDMLPSKTPSVVNTYKFAIGIVNTVYPLSKVYNFTVANYDSVLVYVGKIQNGIMRYTLLLKDVDYFVDNAQPYVLISKQLDDGDIVVVKEYNQTYGNYVPNTPTKVGLYPKFIPDIILDETYLNPTFFIKGHDGSLTKLYGDLDEYGNLIDFRDKVLFEFECRIYNNIKVDAKLPLSYVDIFPGQFRTTEYDYDSIMQLYTTTFLNWVGLNRIDMASQYYDSTNEYTWNYNKAKNKIDNTIFKQGNWRGIYMWFYDTPTPHSTPWEMLGFPVKPTWWDERYGLLPYTSDNLLLWTDLSNGYVYNNGNPYIDARYKRPGLLDILPVNSNGELLSPFISLTRNYNKMAFQSNWVIGDMGPAEYSYRKSSTWPFDLIRLFALTKPAQFFTLGLDLDVYKYNYEFNQYLVYDRSRTTGRQQLTLYGHDIYSPAHSYLNWSIDYLKQYGIDGTTLIENLLTYVDVRLSYKVSGYTDKNKINFYIEKGSPNSTNNSLLIPDDSYTILQYKNEPNSSIIYSSVIIQKTEAGFKVFGNSQNQTYFIVSVAKQKSKQKLIKVNELQLYLDTDFTNEFVFYPYGYQFNNLLDLCNFLIGYGDFLSLQGLVFDDSENSTVLDWYQMVAEVMYWSQTGWETGSVINLNPCANNFHVENNVGLVESFTKKQDNYVLNQNLVPINLNDLSLYRKDNTFKLKVLNDGDTISYLRANISIQEHLVIFDNQTVFNDIIYNLVTGLRQQRLYINGSKTKQWDGTMFAPGFIQNQNNVENWKEHTKYTKGTIVFYKRKYWMANKAVILPSTIFDHNDWLLTNYDKIDTGMLANPSTRASESSLFYDTQNRNIQTDGDQLGFSLIGYRPRKYLADADLDDISQVNVYKNMISEKGTLDVVNMFQGATVHNKTLEYNINENWTIKNAEYGGILNHNFVEFTLDENLLTGNPAIVSLINGNSVDIAQQQIPLYKIKNYGRMITDSKILPTVGDNSITKLPSAGYANLDDITLYSYSVERISNLVTNQVFKNDYIWIADKQNDWDVYTPYSLDIDLISLVNNLDDTCSLNFSDPHGLEKYDTLAIINDNNQSKSIINGFYVVQEILNNKSVKINLSLQSSITTFNFKTRLLVYKFQSLRISKPNQINTLPLLGYEYGNVNVYVDQNYDNNWAVYQKNNNYTDVNFQLFDINNTGLGTAVAYMPPLGYYISDPGKGKVYKYIRSGKGEIKTDTITHGTGYGTAMARNSEFMIVSEPNDTLSKLYIYRIVALPEVEALVEEQVLTVSGAYVGTSMAFSGDSNYLFVGAPKINSVFYFKRKTDYTLLPSLVTNNSVIQVSNVTSNSPSTGKMTITFTSPSFALTSNLNVGSTFTLSGFVPALTSTKQKINGTHTVTDITTKPGHTDQVITVSFNITGTWTKGTDGVYGAVVYNPQPEIGQLIQPTNPLDRYFVLEGNAVNTIVAGKRVTFLQYKQIGTSVLKEWGYEAKGSYSLTDAKNATIVIGDKNFATDKRNYYIIVTGNIVGYHFAIDPSIDNVDYIATDGTNATYNSGSDTTKIYLSNSSVDYMAAILYTELFSGLDNRPLVSRLTSASIPVTSNSPKIFTYTNMLPTYLTVLTGEYDGITDTTKIHTVERIGYSIGITSIPSIGTNSNTFINTLNNEYQLIGTFNMLSYDSFYLGKNPSNLANPTDTAIYQTNDNFGASIAVSYDASKIFVGSPTYHVRLSNNENVPPVPDVGVVWVFDRLIETFQVQYTPRPEVTLNIYKLPFIAHPKSSVTLNGKPISEKQYKVAVNNIILAVKLKAGDIITISDPQLVLMQVLTSYEDIDGVIPSQRFGTSVACNSTGSEVLIGSPYDHTKDGQDGAVYRFTSEGKRFGYTTALLPAYIKHVSNNATYLFINGYSVYLDISVNRDAGYIANQINHTQITNIFAYVTEDYRLVVRLINPDLGPENNKLNITAFNGNYFAQLGIAPYTKTQVIREPHSQHNSKFGYRIAFNEHNSFVVTSPEANRYSGTYFDKNYSNDHYNTVFDCNLTTFEDVFYNAGAAYMYDYLKPYDESLSNLGEYVYAQPINDNSLLYGSQPLYGNSISFNDNTVMIGSPKYDYGSIKVGGKVNVFENTTGNQNWSVYRTSTEVVDVNKIQKIQLYNNITNENLVSLDYIDPLNGKLLGAVRKNLDYIGITDPASYNNVYITSSTMVWSKEQVGQLWFNTNSTKFLNYHQNDLAYNSKYWGQIFPGSTVTVYTWIESDVVPVQYKGPGIPLNLQKYTTTYGSNSNNSLVEKYYYWVRNTNTLYGDKTLSDSVIESYITNPQNSGIPYMAPVRGDTFALYNVRDNINGSLTNLHVGFSTGDTDTSIQNQFKLIQTNSPSDFLPGLPNYSLGHSDPSGLYNRLLESFCGIDETGASVPNYLLPDYMQVGINVRPRQSMFIDRFGALKNYLEYANSVLLQYPINEFSNLTYLATSGDYFNTSSYWYNVYYWADGYNDKTKTKVEVGIYADLYKVNATEGLIAGVSKNGQGKREVYLYTNNAWTRIGLQDGTIQFSDKLYDYQNNKIGFGDNFFDTVSFDSFPAVETYYIIRALNEQIYVGPLLEHRNKSLILMFEYIQSENVNGHNNLPWLNKTSFADVTFTVRDLEQEVYYHQDNTTLLSGYINEVKPYHTVIKDFNLRYTDIDIINSTASDFDINPVYNSKTGKFVSPQLSFTDTNAGKNIYGVGDDIWTNSNFANWYNNFGLALNGIPNFELGILTLYMTPTTNTLYIDNARGMPDAGILYIEDEVIGYTTVNRETGLVSGLTRGIGNSLVSEHYPGIIIRTDLPGVVVLDTGRDYIDPPKVTAYIDTTKYPAPTREAVLQPVMNNGKVISINILDPGENYSATPEIIFTSSFDVKFNKSDLNFINNTIIIPTTKLKTGDLIKSTCTDGFGSIIDGYYYVYVVATLEGEEVITITLHKTLSNSLTGHDNIKLHAGTINQAITGTEYVFSITARAIGITTNLNVRSLASTLRYDRTSYVPKVSTWEPNKFYGSRYAPIGLDNLNSTSSDVSLSSGLPYNGLTGTVSYPDTSLGTGATFNVTNVLLGGTYNVSMTNGGTNYGVFDTIKILGTTLSGTTPTNDCLIQVTTVGSSYKDLLQDTTTGSGTGARFTITTDVRSEEVTGTLNVTNNSNIVTGTNTLFYSELMHGSIIFVNGVQCVVDQITTSDPLNADFNIKLTLTSNYVGTTGSYKGRVAFSTYNVQIDSVFYPGVGYQVNDSITITGDRLNGTSPINDLIINVSQVDSDGKVLAAGAKTGLNYGVPVYKGTIKTFTYSGIALDSNFASLQGAVLPIKSIGNDHGVTSDFDGNTIVRLDYYPSALKPGQIQGAKTYFYHNTAPYVYSSNGTIINIYKPRFNPYNITQSYFMKIINSGSQHYVGEEIIISGSVLGGSTKNKAIIKVTQIINIVSDPIHGFVGAIEEATITGLSTKVFDEYYVQPINLEEVQVFHDPGMRIPVKYTDFNYKHNNDWVDDVHHTTLDFTPNTPNTQIDYQVEYQSHGLTNISDFAFIPEPFTLGLSYKYDFNDCVVYNNNVYRCIESNNDSTFDLTKWVRLQSDDRSLNALDRIVAYYEPAINMPAKDLQQLVRGISYPGNVYYGNSFSPEDIIPIDISLKGQELFPRQLNIKAIINNTIQLTGSLVLTKGSPNVTGIGTLFVKELSEDTVIYINDYEYTVLSVNNNNNITLYSNYNETSGISSAYKFQYIAIAESVDRSILLNSIDGVNWNNHTLAETSLLVTDIIYENEKYLLSTLSTNNPMLTSHDGVTWLGQGQSTLFDQQGFDDDYFDSSPESYPADSVNRIIYGSDGSYYGVGSIITRSVNGVEWYKQFDFGTKTFNLIYDITEVNASAFRGFIAVGSGNQILSGIDTAVPDVTTCSVIITSLDGKVWNLQNPFLSRNGLRTIVSNSDIIVIAGENGKIWYSINGYNWTPGIISGSAINYTFNKGIYDNVNGKFIIVGDHGTIIVSTDGIHWTQTSNNSITIDKLNDVMYDGTYYYIVGANATIIRSIDAISWNIVNLLTPGEPDSVVAGHDFLYGYGPEELIPGLMTESLSIKVLTSPGANWDDTPVLASSAFYQNTSFDSKSITSTTNIVNFSKLLKNPAKLSLYLIDSTTYLGNRIYTGYTIDWINKTVTLGTSLPSGKLLMVEVHEVGNGKQISRSNNKFIPLRTNSITGNSEIFINYIYSPLLTPPVVYVNGNQLLYQVDYEYTFGDNVENSKIIFNDTYDQETDYVTWAILDTSKNVFNNQTEISYSIPETQLFTNSTSKNKTLTNNIGGSNVDNAIVEKNGLRLIPTVDYSIDFLTHTLTLVNNIISTDTIAVTTFNETNRLFIETMIYTATASQTVFAVTEPVTDVTKALIYYTDVNKAYVTINGKRIHSSKLSYDNANNLTIDATINSGDIVIITVTLDNGTPNSMKYSIDVDRYGKTNVYRSNEDDGTWLTQNFNLGDTTLKVYNVNKLLDDVSQTTIVNVTNSGQLNEKRFAYIECDINLVKKVTIQNVTKDAPVASYLLETLNGRSIILLTDHTEIDEDDILSISLKLGNTLELNGEKIRFTDVNFADNTVSGLTRGVLGTGPVLSTSEYAMVYGITKNRTLDPQYYNQIWNTSNYQANYGDPLQVSNSPAANFLKYGYY